MSRHRASDTPGDLAESAAVEPGAADDQIAAGAFDALDETRVSLAARGIHDQPHRVAGLQRGLRPAARLGPLERRPFTTPVLVRTIGPRDAQQHPGVRAAPLPLG